MSDEIMFTFGEDGVAREYDDTWDITIHCESKEEQDEVWAELKKKEWIPCSERLPEKYGHYLVTMTEKARTEDLGFLLDEIEVRKMRYNSDGWMLPRHMPSWINKEIVSEVIAWMPLPEPYKEGDSDDKQ